VLQFQFSSVKSGQKLTRNSQIMHGIATRQLLLAAADAWHWASTSRRDMGYNNTHMCTVQFPTKLHF